MNWCDFFVQFEWEFDLLLEEFCDHFIGLLQNPLRRQADSVGNPDDWYLDGTHTSLSWKMQLPTRTCDIYLQRHVYEHCPAGKDIRVAAHWEFIDTIALV